MIGIVIQLEKHLAVFKIRLHAPHGSTFSKLNGYISNQVRDYKTALIKLFQFYFKIAFRNLEVELESESGYTDKIASLTIRSASTEVRLPFSESMATITFIFLFRISQSRFPAFESWKIFAHHFSGFTLAHARIS